ncbi:MAG: amino acid adenylation domain-containing protein, partial [Gammaproteobacteria bacterium]|nr:amino acid adenylation domain-containing protein [Gammaproteobacteria bacterium]
MPGYPLSPVQQGMLFHSLYGEDCGVYLQQFIWDLREMLDVSAFERAWQRVIERHAILRTSFHWRDTDKPLQMVHQRVDCPLEIQDWRGLPDREERFSAYLKTDRARGFDFTASPVMRRALFRLKEAEYRFLWTYHHALLDGRSRLLIVQEIFAFYEGFCRGRALALPLPPPYQDYIEWLQSQDFSKAKAFWRQMLNGLSAPTPLIEERAGKPVEEKAPHAEKTLNLTKAETENLHALARTADITLNTLVQSAWTLLLSRYSGEETVLFGATRGGRHSPSIDIKFMAGLFINTLPVRIQVMPDQSLSAWLQYVRKQWLSIREHEHTPLILAQEWSEMPAGVPLFESIIVLENYDFNTVFQARGGKWARRRFKLLQHTHYPLTLMVTTGAELQFALEYDTHRFSAGTIKDMLCHLQILLNGMADNPRQPVSALPMLGEAERHCLLTEWNNTESRYPHDKCLHQLFEAQAERTPDAPAVLFEQRQLTYRTLNVRANQLAHYLRTLAAGPEVLIALCAERSPEMLIALLGILKAGSAYIPLDPAYPEDRLAFMLEDAQAPVLLTQESLAGKFVQSRQNFQIVCLDRERERAEISRQNDNNPPCTAHPENLAYVIYTSGSTGKPKGVQIAHRSLVNFLWSMRREPGLTEQDILLAVTTISFDIAALELYLPLLTGACIVLASRETAADGPELLKKLAGVTVMQATPATWRLLLVSLAHDSKIQRNSEAPDLKGLKILCGGEALTPDLAGRLLKIGGEVWNLYGPTETTVWSAACRITEEPRKKGKNTSVSIGRPIANTQIYILDRCLQPVPAGVAGELYIGGAGLARGYLKRPELSANSFINQSGYFSDEPEARLYKTGDLARYLPDGRIECLGRA